MYFLIFLSVFFLRVNVLFFFYKLYPCHPQPYPQHPLFSLLNDNSNSLGRQLTDIQYSNTNPEN